MKNDYLMTWFDENNIVTTMRGNLSDLIHIGIYWLLTATKTVDPEVIIEDNAGHNVYYANIKDMTPIIHAGMHFI